MFWIFLKFPKVFKDFWGWALESLKTPGCFKKIQKIQDFSDYSGLGRAPY
jgi:hypothetical protein